MTEPTGLEKHTIDLRQFPGVMENLPCCFYIAEGKEPYRLLYANEQTIRLLDCRDLEDLYRHTAGMAFHFIAMDDRARIKRDILHALAKTPEGFSHARGHLFTRTNRIRYADVSGRRVQTEAYGPVYYCTIQEIDIPRPGAVVDRDIRDHVIRHLDEAIEKHWLQVYYQPVIRTMTGELCGMEALARWIDPEIGFLSPGSFIPVLEQVRLIHRLDAFVLEEVCRMLRQRLDENLPITPVSFNLSRYDFDMLDIFDLVETTRRKYAVPRDFLHVEITESVLSRDSGAVQQAINRLRQEGYEIWLDDFGSGYSSLNILKDYTVDLIKLDMGFLRSFTEKSRSIISSVIGMAKDLGIKTLAEGVETQEHADFLASIGCGRQQGFFYGKPRPLAGTLAHIREERRGIEQRKWCHYYDVASMVVRQTNRTSALFDALENGRLRFLYTNKAYREQLQALGYRLQDIEENLSIKGKTEVYDLFWEVVNRSRQSHKEEAFCYIDSGNYINARLRVVYAMNRHLLIHIEFQNISKSIEGMQQRKLDDNLRYLYSIFENVCIVDFQQDTIDQIYEQGGILGNGGKPGVTHDIRKALQEVAQEFVYEEDRARYLAFCDPETIVERIRKSPYGRISCRFRVRDRQGKYDWRECIAILLSSGTHPLMLTATWVVEAPTLLPEGTAATSKDFAALLWQSFQRNTRFRYFWKDKERRFLGATKSFLKYYGFQSVDEIVGKTDEDMNWHVDNNAYRLDELDVLHKGKTIENVVGECIIQGELHHITCYKWPLYQNGEIIGLMGVFFDADAMYRDLHQKLPSPFEDTITGLHNRQGFLGDLTRYQEAYTMDKQDYALILLESRFDEHIQDSYDSSFLRVLVREEAGILRRRTGKDAVISRIQNATFAILRRETSHKESEELARELQYRLQAIHEVAGNPVTITYGYSVVHSDDPAIHHLSDTSISHIYRLAMERLRHKS